MRPYISLPDIPILLQATFVLDPQNPPLIKELQTLPLFSRLSAAFQPDSQQWRDADSYSHRPGLAVQIENSCRSDTPFESALLICCFGVLLVALIGWWAYRLWGMRAAVLAMVLACFEPNLVAHSSLVTTDIGVTLFVFLALYLLWEYVNFPTWSRLGRNGISTGMALVCQIFIRYS